MLSKLYAPLAAIVSVVAALFFAKKSGIKQGKIKQQQQYNEETLNSVKRAKKISDKVGNYTHDELVSELRRLGSTKNNI